MDRIQPGPHADRDALWDWNLVSDRVHFSPRWLALVGCEDHHVGDTPEEWLQRIHPDDVDLVLRELEAARNGEQRDFSFRHRLRHQDGRYRWVACRGTAVDDGARVVRLTGSLADVTADTFTDIATGLPNRLLLIDRIGHAIDRARQYQQFHFALLMIDPGRPAGVAAAAPDSRDPLLAGAARRLETALRTTSPSSSSPHDLVARLDGDRIAVLLEELKTLADATTMAQRLLDQLLVPLKVDGRDLFLSPSIGVALSPTGYVQADDVLRDAEIALHRAQVLGGSHWEVFDTDILRSEQTALQLEADLEAALERGEFELFYQPIVSLTSHHIVGFEALARWRHPQFGPVSPVDFIPIAERTGFIVPLGRWILRQACLRLKAWRDGMASDSELWISVNLSSVQLRDPELVAQVAGALQESGLDARHLVLELTEGTAMANPTAARTLFMQLRALGVRISIDDFGTGYSSLAYLQQLPVDALKVDRAFIRGMETRSGSADIVATLTTMAKQMGVYVIAEGIENDDQLALIRSLHCQSAQGDLFAKPLDDVAATKLLESGLPARPAAAGKGPVTRRRPAPARRVVVRRAAAAAAVSGILASAGLARTLMTVPRPDEPAIPAVFVGAVTLPSPDVAMALPMPSRDTRAAAAAPPAAPARSVSSVKVAHLHRLGSCTGQLVVTANGLSFVPDDAANDDAFTFSHTEFLHTVEDGRLTITSNDRTYRFRAAAEADRGTAGTPLTDFAGNITLFRSQPPTARTPQE